MAGRSHPLRNAFQFAKVLFVDSRRQYSRGAFNQPGPRHAARMLPGLARHPQVVGYLRREKVPMLEPTLFGLTLNVQVDPTMAFKAFGLCHALVLFRGKRSLGGGLAAR